jgi:hypothetical protein
MSVPFEPEKLVELFEFIARGLAWHHWRMLIAADTVVWAGILNGAGEALFRQLFGYRTKAQITGSLGNGTFTYEGGQSSENPQMTIWRFCVYGGATFSGDPDAPLDCNSVIGAVTGSKQMMAKFVALANGEMIPAT